MRLKRLAVPHVFPSLPKKYLLIQLAKPHSTASSSPARCGKDNALVSQKNEALLKRESFTNFEECNQKILLEPLLVGYVKMSGEGCMQCSL